MSTITDQNIDLLPVNTDIVGGFLPLNERTEEQRIWAASVLAELPTKLHFSQIRSVEEVRDERGAAWRRAFVIRAIPGKFFEIQLWRGASPSDLKRAERLIERAKEGYFNDDIWTATTYEIAGPGYFCSEHWEWDGKRDIDEIRPCTMPGCTDQYHEYRGGEFNAAHRAEDIEKDHYLITLRNYEDEDKWAPYIDLDIDIPVGPAGLKILRDAANDYAWLQQEADKLNAQMAEVKGA